MSESLYTRYDFNKMFELATEVFIRYGYTREESEQIADVIMTSDKYGVESHGCNRLTLYPTGIDLGRIHTDAQCEVVQDSGCIAVIDAHEGMGQLAGVKGMKLAIEKAKEFGVGMVSVRNSNHYGIAGYYSMMAANEGMMGVSMTNAEALVVPTYAKEPMLGTNPIAVSIPATPHPFHMDFATSIMTNGKMEVYAKTDHTLEPGMLMDEEGKITLDPKVSLRIRKNKTDPNYTKKTMGGIMPMGGAGMLFGGHKGYGFALLVDIMCAVMSQGAVSRECRVTKDKELVCHYFCAIDISRYGDKDAIIERLSEYLQSMRDAETCVGEDRVYVHGDKEAEATKDVLENGVAINEATREEIKKYCDKLGINIDDYMVPVK